jgi:hypothetical protein
MQGGMEAVYDDITGETGFLRFAPAADARGSMFSARGRTRRPGSAATPPAVGEDKLYP